MALDQNRVNEVAAALVGTTKGLEEEATQEERDSVAFCTALDEQCMHCSSCGWWVETEEMGEGDECIDCEADNIPDDEKELDFDEDDDDGDDFDASDLDDLNEDSPDYGRW